MTEVGCVLVNDSQQPCRHRRTLDHEITLLALKADATDFTVTNADANSNLTQTGLADLNQCDLNH